ncbi:MAG: hypothetical protein WBC44_14600 [Planctomycetaceae bacterium]
MTTLTSEDRRQLYVGVAIAVALFCACLWFLRGDGLFRDAGEVYGSPFGAVSLGQIAVSLLIGLGGAAIKVGAGLLKRLLGLASPATGPAGKAAGELIDELARLAAERLAARDKEGYQLVYELHGRCTQHAAAPEDSPRPQVKFEGFAPSSNATV